MENLAFLFELIHNYGYPIILVVIMFESAGLPLPGETVLVVAAAFAGAGHLNIALVIIHAALGAIIGDAGGYWIGRKLGRPFLFKYGKWLHLTEERLQKIERLFKRHGAITIFFGRFFTLLRTYAALFAGVWHMPYKTFTLYNASGGIVWALCFGMLGFLFGQNIPFLLHILKTIGWILLIPFAGSICCIIIWRWVAKHQDRIIARFHAALNTSFIGYIHKHYSWQIHWVLRHWPKYEYMVLHALVGLVVSGVGIWLFAWIAHSAFTNASIAHLDQTLLRVLASAATPLATLGFSFLMYCGSYGLIIAFAVTALVFIIYRSWFKLVSLCSVALGGQVLVFFLTLEYSHADGDRLYEYVLSTVSNFPSSHTMESLIVYGIVAYFCVLKISRWGLRTGLVLGTVFLVFCIGFGRIYLGMNYFSSVACGLAGGLVWLSTSISALELLRRGEVGDRRRLRRAHKPIKKV